MTYTTLSKTSLGNYGFYSAFSSAGGGGGAYFLPLAGYYATGSGSGFLKVPIA